MTYRDFYAHLIYHKFLKYNHWTDELLDRMVNEQVFLSKHIDERCGGLTALAYAVLKNNTESIKILLAAGADVNYKTYKDHKILLLALDHAKVENIKLLLAAGIEVNCRYKNGFTPLMYAIRTSKKENIKLLLAAEANLNDEDYYGRTALMLAMIYDKKEIIKILLTAEADPNRPNSYGYSAFSYKRNEKYKALLS
jgi:ankyrin repeat protein